MLSVVIDARDSAERLPNLLSALTSAAVEGLVREVLICGGGPAELLEVLRDETGAELAADVAEGVRRSRGDLLLVLPAALRLKANWLEVLAAHLRGGGREALLMGEGGGLFRRPYGLLITKAKAAGSVHADLKGLRGKLGSGAGRLV
jgi:hypothetical protein